MGISLIIGIIAIALILILMEIYIIPGTTIFGIAGGLLLLGIVVYAYQTEGTAVGNTVLAVSLFSTAIALWLGFKAVQSRRLSLNSSIDGHVNELEVDLNVGDKGETLSVLRPNGKARFGEVKVEVYSQGEYLDTNTKVEIIRIEQNRIFVKPII